MFRSQAGVSAIQTSAGVDDRQDLVRSQATLKDASRDLGVRI